MGNLVNASDTLKIQREKINEAINRIDNIASQAGDDNTEIVDARVDTNRNITYTVLKDRLDQDSADILDHESRITQNESDIVTNSDKIDTLQQNIQESNFTPQIHNTSSIFSTGKGTDDAGEPLDFSNDVEEGQVKDLVLEGNTRTNLVSLFNSGEWNLHANVTVDSPTKIILNATAGNQVSTITIPVISRKQYTLSFIGVVAGTRIDVFDGDTYINVLSENVQNFTFTPTQNSVKLNLKNSTSGIFTFENVMLEEGTEVKPFIPGTTSTIGQRIVSEGKNLSPNTLLTFGGTWDVDFDFNVGTSNARRGLETPVLVQNGEVTVSHNADSNLKTAIRFEDGTLLTSTTQNPSTITVPRDGYLGFYFVTNDDSEWSYGEQLSDFEFQIEQNSVKTKYEPNKKPSISYFDFPKTGRRLVGKNKFDGELIDGYYDGNGDFISSASYKASKKIETDDSKTYVISGLNQNIVLSKWDNDGNYIGLISSFSNNDTVSNAGYIAFRGDTSLDPTTIQFEKGVVSTPHENYYEYDEREEIRKLPNGIKDTVKNGNLHKRMDKLLLNGTENWLGLTTGTETYRMYLDNVVLDALAETTNSAVAYSSNGNYSAINSSGVDDENIFILNSPRRFYLRINKSKIDSMTGATTEEKYKNYIAKYPLTLIYQLATPKIIPLNITPLTAYPGGRVRVEPWIGKEVERLDNGTENEAMGNRFVQRVSDDVKLDGSLDWKYLADREGFKIFYLDDTDIINMKFTGLVGDIIVRDDIGNVLANETTSNLNNNANTTTTSIFRIAIDDSLTGFTEGYAPTSQDIKDYFNAHPYTLWHELATPIEYYSTTPTTIMSFPSNLKAQVESLNKGVNQLSGNVIDLQTQIDLLMILNS